LTDAGRNVTPKRDFLPTCAWHQKERGIVEHHYLDRCAQFKALSVKDRRDFVYTNRLCRICFKKNHMAKDVNDAQLV